MWNRGVAALRNPVADAADTRHFRFPWSERTPILITGSAGAGKTAIWRKLTGEQALDQRSTRPDEGYAFIPGRGRNTLTLTTIPGQISEERFRDMRWFFGESSMLEGVIFVATFGFDSIWPDEAEAVASAVSPLDIDTLSQRNVAVELDSFRETCSKLSEKQILTTAARGPRWLLVLANKVDLYWDAIESARQYYAPGSGSIFDQTAQALVRQVRPFGPFRYDVLPVCLESTDYNFAANFGAARARTQLDMQAAASSQRNLVATLEELCRA
jgi:hypothetical protein